MTNPMEEYILNNRSTYSDTPPAPGALKRLLNFFSAVRNG